MRLRLTVDLDVTPVFVHPDVEVDTDGLCDLVSTATEGVLNELLPASRGYEGQIESVWEIAVVEGGVEAL